ncbi:SusC/RagA family TonB-linked outer membrane protein [Chitinophaga sp.]|uniref:SusC/RagA family TonB-linked outer membrane protein n=1 Tax=Chitinophaga sp. TaxID=1869181 RepID=UPI0031D0F22F
MFFLIGSNRLNAQRVDLDVHGQSLHDISQILHDQTGINFTIQAGITNTIGPITLTVFSMPLEIVLKKILNDNYLFEINGKYVQIKYKDPAGKTATVHDLKGIVVDAENRPLAGATIFIKGREKGYITDIGGRFLLLKVTKQDTFTISYMGYKTREFTCNERNFLRCTLSSKEQQLRPVDINKGYYNVNKEVNTGNVGTLFADEIERQPVGDPLQALAGRITGVNINQESGVSGAAVDISIEGINSLSNGTAPLYIVDGVPLTMSVLNQLANAAGNLSSMQLPQPEDIESIEVLKDADASAIYGCRGANGVVLIRTKRPTPGKSTLSMSVYSGQGRITRGLKLMNTQQYLAMRHQALNNDDQKLDSSDYDLTKWDTTRNTDWQKKFIGGHSNITNASGSLTAGNAQTRFSLGGVYRRESALFPGNFASTTLSADMTLLHTSEDKRANVDIGLHYLNNENRLPVSDITSKILLAPNAPSLYTAAGDLNWEDTTFQNPYGELHQRYRAAFNHFLGSCKLSYELLPGFKISANLGYNYIQLAECLIVPLSSMSPDLRTFSATSSHSEGVNAIKSWIVEPQANYTFRINYAHCIDVLMGTTFQQSNQHQSMIVGTDFESDALTDNISLAGHVSISTDKNLYRYNGVYARLGYNYKDLLYLNFTGRNDGSSRYSEKMRTEYFGSAAIAWLFTRMPVFQHIPFLTFGKIYSSIGRTGNDQFSDYQFYDTYTVSTGYGGIQGLERTQLTNYLYNWEILIKSTAGIELRFNRKYTIAVNYFRNHTKNQLVKYDLPAVTGYKYTTANLPAVIQNNGLELELGVKQIQKKNFQWENAFNLTVPYNKLVSYPNIESSLYSSIYAVGQPLSIRYVYQFKGINPATGIAEFADLNKDGKIDGQDRYPRFIGPKFYAGWGNTVTYKGFTFSMFLQLVKQSGYYVASMEMPGRFIASGGNQPLSDDSRWKNVGDIASVQRYAAGDMNAIQATNLQTQSDNSIVDASFIRLKNVFISWDLPQSWNAHVGLKSARFFLSAQNLATWTHFKGMDPETQRFHITYRLPPQRVIVLGLRISL